MVLDGKIHCLMCVNTYSRNCVRGGKIYCIFCVDTYSLNYIHFWLWTLIDSFAGFEIFYGISFIIADDTIVYDSYSTPKDWSRETICVYHQDQLVLPVLLFYQRVAKRWVVSLSSTCSSYSRWGSEYNMYLCWQNYTINFGGKLMYVSSTTDQPGASVGHCVMLCHNDIAPGEFYLPNVLCQYQFVGLDNSTHVSLWSLLISISSSAAC